MKRPQRHWKQRLSQGLHRLLGLRSLSMAAQDTLALQTLAPLSNLYLPWSNFSLRPSAMVSVLNEIQVNQKSQIVECGSGISTVYIAQLLNQLKRGHLYSIDHDLPWLTQIQDLIHNQGLSNYVTFIHAPLSPCSFALSATDWYTPEAIQTAIATSTSTTSPTAKPNVDLLLIDGPPAYDQARELARYPAVPFFQPLFADTITVIVDDIERSGEQRIVQAWEERFDLEFEDYSEAGGIAIARSTKAQRYAIS